MAITWEIDSLERDPATGRVIVAHWRARKVEGPASAETFGLVHLPPGPTDPTDPAFVPFASLTKELVTQWVVNVLSSPTEALGRAALGAAEPTQLDDIEAYLNEQLALQQSPPVLTGTPW